MTRPDTPHTQPTLGWRLLSVIHGVDRVHRIQGGLANQMFQYAHAWALQDRHPARTFIDLSRYEAAPSDRAYRIEHVFEMPDSLPHIPPETSRCISRFGLDRNNRSEESTVCYKEPFLRSDMRGIVQGYFPSFKYSAAISGKIRKNFRFRRPIPERNRALIDRLKEGDAVAIHVRRGDYLKPENRADFYGMCTPKYYRSAVSYLKERRASTWICFFSDDPEWCRHQFADIADHVVEGNNGEDAWADMALMSLCRDSVIANSSYSLWARWLANSINGLDIGPARFLNDCAYGANTDDILPASFVRMDDQGELHPAPNPSSPPL